MNITDEQLKKIRYAITLADNCMKAQDGNTYSQRLNREIVEQAWDVLDDIQPKSFIVCVKYRADVHFDIHNVNNEHEARAEALRRALANVPYDGLSVAVEFANRITPQGEAQ